MPDCYIGRIISDSVSSTKQYIDISWAYWTGEIDAKSTFGGRFWRYNAHVFIHKEMEEHAGEIFNGLNKISFIQQIYFHMGNDFSPSNVQESIDGSPSYTGSIVYIDTHGWYDSITTNNGFLDSLSIPGIINHRYPFVIVRACLTGSFAGPGRDNWDNFACNLLRNSIGVWAWSTNIYVGAGGAGTLINYCLDRLGKGNSFGAATAWGLKDFRDSQRFFSDWDRRTIESFFFFGDPKNNLPPMKINIKVSSINIDPSNYLTDDRLGEAISITASGSINNDNAWSNVGVKFYLDDEEIGYKETGTWIQTGSWSLTCHYTLPYTLSLGSHEIKVRALDADYWYDNFPSYGTGDIDLNGEDSEDWPYCDLYHQIIVI